MAVADSRSHVLSGLIAKRAEIDGQISSTLVMAKPWTHRVELAQ